MRELYILLAPPLWAVKNDIIRFNWSFYRKIFLYAFSSSLFIFLITKLLSTGMTKLQSLSPDVFNLLLIKGYSLIFIIIFFIQVINGLVISLNTYYQSRELDLLFTSPVNRTSLFFSRLFETHIKASWMLIIFGVPLLVSSGLLYQASLFYYPYTLMLFIAFSIIPVNIGIGATMFISSIFHVRKLKKFLLSTGIIAVVAIVTLLRIFRPERFVNPELFANLTLFLSEMKTPSFILLPNRWLSESVFNFLGKTSAINTLIFISLLFLTSYITTLFLLIVFKNYHYRGWALLQGGDIFLKEKRPHISYIRNLVEKILYTKPVQRLLSVLDNQSRIFIRKDFVYQIRDIKNVHQILIILSLIVVYLFSTASLPLNWEYYAVQLKYIISFFNLGLILIIIASLCSRVIYPAVVSEGISLWIIKTSPITPKRYIWTKFLFFFIPIFLLGQLLTIFSSSFIGIERPLFMLKIVTTTLLSFSLVSMAIVFGISDLRQTINEDAKEQTRIGSTAYMLVSIFLILSALALEIIPIFLYFLKEAAGAVFTQKAWIMIGGMISILLLVNFLVTSISIHLSIKRYKKLQLIS